MKNSQKLLLGFAVVAVILIAVVALKYPPVESPDAQGAIGAVEKYREEQIKPADVVLGDEQNRKLEAALYGSLLEEAAQLRSFSADLAGFSRTVDNREQLAAFEQGLASRENDLAKSALMAAADLQAKEQLAAFKNDLGAISRGFDNRANLGLKDLQSFEASLASIQQDLAAKAGLQSQEMMAAHARLESFNKLDSKTATLDSMEAELASMDQALEAFDQLEMRQLEMRALQNRADQLGVRMMEARSLMGVRQDLAAIETSLESKSNLGDRAAALDARSAEFLGLSARLEKSALASMSARLEMRNLQAKVQLGLAQKLESVSRDLQSRQNLESKHLASMSDSLQSFQKGLGNREADLNQKFALGMRAELAAINNHLDNRSNLSAKFDLASKSNLEAKSNLGSESELASRQQLGSDTELASRNNLQSFNQYLGSLSRAYESRSGLASREADLGSRAQELQNRAADLQAKSNF